MPPSARTTARTTRSRTDNDTPPATAPAAARPRTRRKAAADATTKPEPKRAHRSAGITVADDAAKFTPPEQAPATSPGAATPASPRMPAGRKPWERELDERRTAISVRMPESLKARLDGLHDYLQLTDPEKLTALLSDCANQTDLFNHALHRLLTAAEDESNGGKPFPIKIRRGR